LIGRHTEEGICESDRYKCGKGKRGTKRKSFVLLLLCNVSTSSMRRIETATEKRKKKGFFSRRNLWKMEHERNINIKVKSLLEKGVANQSVR